MLKPPGYFWRAFHLNFHKANHGYGKQDMVYPTHAENHVQSHPMICTKNLEYFAFNSTQTLQNMGRKHAHRI